MKQKLRIGKIPYANLFPVFYVLEDECDCKDYEFIEGFPSALNRMLRENQVDISPSSSIEYLRNENTYTFIQGHSISSKGSVESILLFSRTPLEELDNKEVFVTHQSETSIALLEIILKKFYSINCDIRTSTMPAEKALVSYTAYLSIGDEALITANKAHEASFEKDYRILEINNQSFYTYDLGHLWHKNTNVPFVYALWIARKNLPEEKKELFERFKKDLNYSLHSAMKKLPDIAKVSPLKNVIPPDRLVSYWKGISYDYSDEHKKGLRLFQNYLKELGLL
jgi:chorismate dehydratase